MLNFTPNVKVNEDNFQTKFSKQVDNVCKVIPHVPNKEYIIALPYKELG